MKEIVAEADLLIAATAIARDLPFKTRDKHFQKLTAMGLKLT